MDNCKCPQRHWDINTDKMSALRVTNVSTSTVTWATIQQTTPVSAKTKNCLHQYRQKPVECSKNC